MHDGAGQVPNQVDVGQKLIVARKKTTIDEVVALDAGEGDGVVVGAEQLDSLRIGHQRERAALPHRPCPRRRQLHLTIGMREAPVVIRDHIPPLACRDRLAELFKGLGKQPVAAFLVEPGQLFAAQQKDAPQHQFADPVGMQLRVGEGQRRAPGATKQLPALDVEVKAQPLHVGHQIPGGVVLEAGVWPRAATAALVEQDDAVAAGIMISTHAGVAATTRTAMYDQHWLAAWVAAFLEINLVLVANFEMLLAIGLDRKVETEPLTCRHHYLFPPFAAAVSLPKSMHYTGLLGQGMFPTSRLSHALRRGCGSSDATGAFRDRTRSPRPARASHAAVRARCDRRSAR